MKITLKKPIKITGCDDEVKSVEVGEYTAGDILEATQESERLVVATDGSSNLVSSDLEVSYRLAGLCVKKAGKREGKLILQEVKLLHPSDIDAINSAADTYVFLKTKEDLEKAGKQ